MKAFQRGHIWLVNFEPSIGHEYQKVRPALIVQQNRYIASETLLTVIPLSTQLDKARELDVRIAKDAENRLLKNSLLKTTQISSFDRRRFLKYIGTLNRAMMACIDVNIHRFLFGEAHPHPEQKNAEGSMESQKSSTTQKPDNTESKP